MFAFLNATLTKQQSLQNNEKSLRYLYIKMILSLNKKACRGSHVSFLSFTGMLFHGNDISQAQKRPDVCQG